VWEPETLNAEDADKQAEPTDSDSDSDSESDSDEPQFLSTAEAEEQCDAFSIRGEIAKYAEDKHEIVVNIVQKSKSEAKPKRPFKLLINGQLSGRATGYFWDLQVERQAGQLVLKEGTQIAVVPPKKKPKNARSGGKGGPGGRRPAFGKPRSAGAPVPKPVPKPKTGEKSAGENPTGEKPLEKSVEKPITTKLAAETLPVESPVAESPVVESQVVESPAAVESKAELKADKKPVEPAEPNPDSAA
jgi:hypothetical protein